MSNSFIAAQVTEYTVYGLFVIACFNALGQGRRWFFTLVWGAVAGFCAEVYLVHQPTPRYEYGTQLFWLNLGNVPICVGLGWGMVIYVASWTAQRLGFKSSPMTAFIAGLLGVNLDLSLDPVANRHGFWRWKDLDVPGFDPNAALFFEVPFDNFVAWMAIIGIYSLFVRLVFRAVNRWALGEMSGPPGSAALAPSRKGSFWFDFLVPLVAAGLAAFVFVNVRGYAEEIYVLVGRVDGWLGHALGEAIVFGAMFIVGLAILWRQVFRSSTDHEPNYVVLAIVVYFHLLSLGLLFASGLEGATALLVIIPLNLVAGFLAYAWPSMDVLCKKPVGPLDGPFRLPKLIYRTLSSYGGVKQVAKVCSPANEAELDAVLVHARKNQKLVTFRAGGQAFDTQSLNHEIVVSLDRFKDIDLCIASKTVTVGCGATWAEVLKVTLPRGLAPYIMVTSSAATVGGTLSSHSMSRFSPTCGREGQYVESLTLITPAGERLECSRKVTPELFYGVIAGLGYLGAVLRITYRLQTVPENALVRTEFTLVEGLAAIGKAVKTDTKKKQWFSPLTGELVTQTQRHCPPAAAGAPAVGAAAKPVALSAAVNMRGGVWALIARSEYVEPSTPLNRSIFHSPYSLRHFILQLFAAIPGLRTLGYLLTYRAYARKTRVFVDDPFGYTFFEDGNRRLRRLLNLLGFPCRLLQQTYMIPRAATGDGGEVLSKFLAAADRHLDEQKLDPALIDVVYVGKDPDAFHLSSSATDDCFAVTFTFERVFRSLEREREAAMALAAICRDLDGRVHLVKNVYARKGDIQAMYAAGLQRMNALRTTYGAAQVLRNEFSDRNLF